MCIKREIAKKRKKNQKRDHQRGQGGTLGRSTPGAKTDSKRRLRVGDKREPEGNGGEIKKQPGRKKDKRKLTLREVDTC